MRRERRKHRTCLPTICVGVSVLLFLLSLGLLLHRCTHPPRPKWELHGQTLSLGTGQAVTLQRQEPQLPNGCEVTSLAMLLEGAGYCVDKEELYWEYLPRQNFSYDSQGRETGSNPEQVYVGDASTETAGWYCFEAPLVEAGNRYLQQQGSDLELQVVSGLSQETLNEYLDQATPLVVWVTLDYDQPARCDGGWYLADGSFYSPYRNLHCVVVAGYGEEGYLTADPLHGWRWVEETTFWTVFDAMERRAVVVET